MNFDKILEELKLYSIKDEWKEGWLQSKKEFDINLVNQYLSTDYVNSVNTLFKYNEDILYRIDKVINEFKENIYFKYFFWHVFYKMFIAFDVDRNVVKSWPDLTPLLGENSGVFEILVFSAAAQSLKQKFDQRNIDFKYYADTIYDYTEKLMRFHRSNSKWQTDCQGWIYQIFKGEIINVGRLQYQLCQFSNDYIVYKNKKNGKTIALFTAEQSIRKDGYIDGTNDIYDMDAFKTCFSETNEYVEGNLIFSEGKVSDKVVRLKKNEWECKLQKGDHVLSLHIPERGKLTEEACKSSLNEYLEFHEKYFSDMDFKAVISLTWLFSYNLETILNENSNIVKFKRQFYCIPHKSDNSSTIFFVFGRDKIDLEKTLPKTFLEQKLIESMKNNINFPLARGFILKEDMKKFGQNVYQMAEQI